MSSDAAPYSRSSENTRFYTSPQARHSGYHSAAVDTPVSTEQQLANAQHVEAVLELLLLAAIAVAVFPVSQ
jgi:hypothetical protein